MDELFAIRHSYLIPLLPLLGAAIAGFFGARWLKGQSHWPIWIGVGASAIISISLLFAMMGVAQGEGHAPEKATDYTEATSSEHHDSIAYNKVFFHWITAGDPQAAGTSKNFNADA